MQSSAMTTKSDGADLARFNPQQLDVLRKVLCPDLTNDELAFFEAVCTRLDLDPFAKEIYVEKRKQRGYQGEPDTTKLVFIVGVDGYRKRAEASGEYEGPVPPQWCGKDGVWKDVWLEDGPPAACRVGVKRRGWAEPVMVTVRYSAYCQTKAEYRNNQRTGVEIPNAMWAKMGPEQLAKCGEVLAIKKAWPRQTGGTYAPEELDDVDAIDVKGEAVPTLAPALAAAKAHALPAGNPPPPAVTKASAKAEKAAATPAPAAVTPPAAKESEAVATLPVGKPAAPAAPAALPAEPKPAATEPHDAVTGEIVDDYERQQRLMDRIDRAATKPEMMDLKKQIQEGGFGSDRKTALAKYWTERGEELGIIKRPS